MAPQLPLNEPLIAGKIRQSIEPAMPAVGTRLLRNQVFVDLVVLCRPWQWVKNCFVLAPLLFSPGAWQPSAAGRSLLALLCFCLWSSSVYCLNDLLDAKKDSRHPRKQHRPIPSGRVPAHLAAGLAILLAVGTTLAAALLLPMPVFWIGVLYLANSLVYCLLLKHRVIVDVISIAAGFVLRLLGGCAAIAVPASPWLLVCGFTLALLLGFGKRRLELDGLQSPAGYRSTLESYDAVKLNMLLSITSSVCLLSYMLYTVAPHTVALHKTDRLVFTVPFVAYGIFRYLFKVQEGQFDGPVEVLAKDYVFALNGLLWALSVVVILWLSGSLSVGVL
jgi:decaprenyl-phosphate phosphoribosyltransferase